MQEKEALFVQFIIGDTYTVSLKNTRQPDVGI